MTQEPYGDPASLLRSVLADLARAAYGLLGHYADAEDAVQNGCFKLIMAWPRVAALATCRICAATWSCCAPPVTSTGIARGRSGLAVRAG